MASTRETNRSKSGYPPPTVSSNENVLVLSRLLISVRRVAASHDPSYFLLASSPRCPRLRVRFAVLFSLLVVARAFAPRENPFAISTGSNVSRTRNGGTKRPTYRAVFRPLFHGYRGLLEATYTRVLMIASDRFLAVESYIPLVNYVVDREVRFAVIARDAK